MEGAGPNVICRGAELGREPVFKLSRRLVGKSDGEYAPRVYRVKRGIWRSVLRALFELGKRIFIGKSGQLVTVSCFAEGKQILNAVD